MANQTTHQINIPVQSGQAAAAAGVVDRLASALKTADDQASRAADAVKAAEQAYRSSETAANKAAQAVEKVTLQLEKQLAAKAKAADSGDVRAYRKSQEAIANLVQQQQAAGAAYAKADAQMQANAASLQKLQNAHARAKSSVDSLAQAQTRAIESSKAADKAAQAAQAQAAKAAQEVQLKASGTGKLNEAAEGFGKLGGPVGTLGSRVLGTAEGVNKLFSALGTGKAALAAASAGVAIVVVAVAAAGIAFVASAAKLLTWSIGLSDAAGSARRLLDGIAGTTAGGAELSARLDVLNTQVPQSRDELQAMAAELAKSGLKGAELGDALEAAAVKAAKLKYGPEFAKETLTLGRQAQRLKTNVAGIFSGLNVGPLSEGLAKIVKLFDANTASGKAMQSVFNRLFQPIVDGIADMIPKAVRGFLQLEIYALRGLIAIKPYEPAIKKAAEIFGIWAVGIGVQGAAIVAALVAITALPVAIAAGFVKVYESAKNALSYIERLNLKQVGTNIIQGLADGISAGASTVVKAITGVADGAVTAAKKALGIQSPSTVFRYQIGAQATEGMALAAEDGETRVQAAFKQLATPGAGAASDSSGQGAAGASSAVDASRIVDLSHSTWNFTGVAGVSEMRDSIADVVTKIFEGELVKLGRAAIS
jgi:hypothetical protein